MGKFADKVFADADPAPNSRASLAMRCAGVQMSDDVRRVLALPRRTLDLSRDLTEEHRKPGGTLRLRPIQSAALSEAAEANGLVGAIGIGHGKSLISLLLPVAMKSRRTVILVKPELKRKLLEHDLPFYGKHFDLPLDRITVVAYSELSNAATGVGQLPREWKWLAHLSAGINSILDRLAPDLIVADEAHNLRRAESSRTGRFYRYMRAHPECRFVCLTGTLTSGSIRDFAKLVNTALRKNSPMPLDFRALSDWSAALDPPVSYKGPMPPGALTLLCAGDESVEDGFRRRLVETPGWVATSGASFDGSLYLRARRPTVPAEVERALNQLRATWEIGDLVIDEAMMLAKVERQLACGFYYRWDWPGGKVDHDWLDAQKAWNRECRDFLKHHSRVGMDSPDLYEKAVVAGRVESEAWSAWDAVRLRPKPPTVAVWISDYLIRDAATWARHAEEGIVWYAHTAVGDALAKMFPRYGAGDDAMLARPTSEPIIACSVRAQNEGKDLQRYSRNYVLSPSSNATTWQQLLGRTHRPGQLKDEVWVDVALQTEGNEKALERAFVLAAAVEGTTGDEQLLLRATRV